MTMDRRTQDAAELAQLIGRLEAADPGDASARADLAAGWAAIRTATGAFAGAAAATAAGARLQAALAHADTAMRDAGHGALAMSRAIDELVRVHQLIDGWDEAEGP